VKHLQVQSIRSVSKHLPQIFLVSSGLLLGLVGLLADQLGIGHGSKDFFGPAQWSMIGTGVSMVAMGIFNRQASSIITVNLMVLLPMLLLLDNVLYWTAPWLSKNLVQRMSTSAQTKYQLAHWDTAPVGYEGSVWFHPNHKKLIKVDGVEKLILRIYYIFLGFNSKFFFPSIKTSF
jgi:hypothetical protein